MSTTSIFARSALARLAFACMPRWGPLIGALSPAILGQAAISPMAAQDPGSFRLWAAQTGRDQVSLAWDAVPGATEYRIYLGDPSAPGTFAQRPASALSSSGRSAILNGIQRVANGITLVAADATGRVLRKESFNPVAPATSFPPPTPPAGLTAEAPSASEVTVTWDPVPGATAYYVGRAVPPSGFKPACALCSTEPRYVDRSVTAGQPHTYTIAAIFPSGVSTRVNSNSVTPGQASAASTPSLQPAGTTSTTTTGSSVPAGAPAPPTLVTATATGLGAVRVTWQPSTSPGVTGYQIQRDHIGGLAGFVITVAPTPPWYDDRLFPATAFTSGPLPVTYHVAAITSAGYAIATSNEVLVQSPVTDPSIRPTGTTPAGQPAGAITTTSGTPTGGTTSGTSPTTSTYNPNPVGEIAQGFGSLFTAGADPPTSVTATVAGPAEVRVNWNPSTTPGVTRYIIQRRVNGGSAQMLDVVAETERTYADKFFPSTFFTSGSLRVTYLITSSPGGKDAASSNEVLVQPPAASSGTSPGVAACRLDYQRADNMWAALGRPDGPLGTESISLAAGQGKGFITDWKYEKLRNDGTNYYGSHLRVATNPTSHTIRLLIRSGTLTGLTILSRITNDTVWIRLDPNTMKLLQADLLEVFCEG